MSTSQALTDPILGLLKSLQPCTTIMRTIHFVTTSKLACLKVLVHLLYPYSRRELVWELVPVVIDTATCTCVACSVSSATHRTINIWEVEVSEEFLP